MTTEPEEHVQQYRLSQYREAVAHHEKRLLVWHQQRLALAEQFAEVAQEHGTDLGFGLPLRLADAIIGAQPSAPVPSDYGIEVES